MTSTSSFHRAKYYLPRIAIAVMLALMLLGLSRTQNSLPVLADSRSDTYKNFESPQIHPLALTPDGTRLLAVNSPDSRLSVFDITGSSPRLVAEIPVGLEPVSVAARNNNEAWVTNWLSDSVSIV